MKAEVSGSGLRIAVIGAGVIGLASALALARAGAHVCVFEAAGQPGLRATGRAGGMLGVTYEIEELEKAGALGLARRAIELWPDFAASLQGGATAVDLRFGGALACATTEAEEARLEAVVQTARSKGLPVRALSLTDLTGLEPSLSANTRAAWLMEADGQVDPRSLTTALVTALAKAGGTIVPDAAIASVQVGDGFRIAGAGDWDRILLATGAAAYPDFRSAGGDLIETGVGCIVPVKGHMLAFETGVGAPQHVIRSGGLYIIPKTRWTLVGATSEPGLADETADPDILSSLFDRAVDLVPGLAAARRVDGWAGVRPGTSDGAPMIGETAIAGVHAALGCYRNGILLAPAVVEEVASSILHRDGLPTHGRFNVRRFDKRVAAPQSP